MVITGESIDDSKAFMTISDFMGSSGMHSGVPHSGPPLGLRGGRPPPGLRGGPPLVGLRGGPPHRGGIMPRAEANPLTKKPTDTVTISSKPYQQAQIQAISDLIIRIDHQITNLLTSEGKAGIDKKIRKRMDKAMYEFLWNEFYKQVQASYLYLDAELMSCQEAIDFIDRFIIEPRFKDKLKEVVKDLKI